jgi:hypothetical protein
VRGHRFKAWDKTHNEWYMDGNVFHLEYSGKYGDFYFDNDHPSNMRDVELIWVESTGLHDKNGKEIWEGDKLKRGEGGIGIVSWGDGFWKIDFQTFSTGLSSEYARRLEVIGNIFEGGE